MILAQINRILSRIRNLCIIAALISLSGCTFLLNELQDRNPHENAVFSLRSGIEYFERGKFEQAIRELKQAEVGLATTPKTGYGDILAAKAFGAVARLSLTNITEIPSSSAIDTYLLEAPSHPLRGYLLASLSANFSLQKHNQANEFIRKLFVNYSEEILYKSEANHDSSRFANSVSIPEWKLDIVAGKSLEASGFPNLAQHRLLDACNALENNESNLIKEMRRCNALLSNLYVILGEYHLASRYLINSIDLSDEKRAEFEFSQGHLLRNMAMLSDAIAPKDTITFLENMQREYSALESDLADEWHQMLATALVSSGQSEAGLLEFKKGAAEIDWEGIESANSISSPSVAKVAAKYGHLLVQAGKVQEGLDVLRRSISAMSSESLLNPNLVDALMWLANAERLLGRYKREYLSLSAAIDLISWSKGDMCPRDGLGVLLRAKASDSLRRRGLQKPSAELAAKTARLMLVCMYKKQGFLRADKVFSILAATLYPITTQSLKPNIRVPEQSSPTDLKLTPIQYQGLAANSAFGKTIAAFRAGIIGDDFEAFSYSDNKFDLYYSYIAELVDSNFEIPSEHAANISQFTLGRKASLFRLLNLQSQAFHNCNVRGHLEIIARLLGIKGKQVTNFVEDHLNDEDMKNTKNIIINNELANSSRSQSGYLKARVAASCISEKELLNVTTGLLRTEQNVQDRIGKDGMFINIVRFARYRPPDFDSSVDEYMAMLAYRNQDGTIKFDIQTLGSAEPIDKLVRTLKSKIISKESIAIPSKKLGKLLLGPFEKHLDTSLTLIISPDSELDLFPWEVLELPIAKKLLIDQVKNTIYSTGASLFIDKNEEQTTNDDFVIVGAPDVNWSGDAHMSSSFDVLSCPGRQPPLLNTLTSINQLEEMARNVGYNVNRFGTGGKPATEEMVKLIQKPKILHFLTHGYACEFDDEQLNSKSTANLKGVSAKFDQFSHTGLALRGANRLPSGYEIQGEDGLLTAREIMSLDLKGTKLVTVGVCEGGLGASSDRGQGTASLRSAFRIAGAQRILFSVWKVPEKETNQLLSRFYAEILDGQPEPAALARARNEIRKGSSEKSHPYYWSGFLLEMNGSQIR